MLRSTVRIVGVLLVVFGCALWLTKPASRPALPPASPVATYAPPKPPRPKSVHPAAHGENALASRARPAAAAPVPVIPKSPPLSSVQLSIHSAAGSYGYRFLIHLFKKDGWFDTGIPITADLFITYYCANEPRNPPPCAAGVQTMVGDSLIPQPSPDGIGVFTLLTTELVGQKRRQAEYLPLQPDATPTLKLRIFPPNGSDDLMYRVRVTSILPGQTEATAAARREENLLDHWEGK